MPPFMGFVNRGFQVIKNKSITKATNTTAVTRKNGLSQETTFGAGAISSVETFYEIICFCTMKSNL